MRRITLIILLVVVFLRTGKTEVRVLGQFSADTVEIGSEVRFILSVESDEPIDILGVPRYFVDSVYSVVQTYMNDQDTTDGITPYIADFELLDLGLWKIIDDDPLFRDSELAWNESSAGSKFLYENAFVFRFWDPGDNVIVLPPIIFSRDGVQDEVYPRSQVAVFIAPPGGIASLQDTADLAPIKPILTEQANWQDYAPFIYGVGVIALLSFLLFYFLNRKKRSEIQEIQVEEEFVPAHIRALTALSDLQKAELWQKGNIKGYQSELTRIIRQYLEDRFHVPALESVTHEIIQKLSKVLTSRDDILMLENILQVADLVKFAKATPEQNIHEEFMNKAILFVNKTKRDYEEE